MTTVWCEGTRRGDVGTDMSDGDADAVDEVRRNGYAEAASDVFVLQADPATAGRVAA